LSWSSSALDLALYLVIRPDQGEQTDITTICATPGISSWATLDRTLKNLVIDPSATA
jgi:hypothetical protein